MNVNISQDAPSVSPAYIGDFNRILKGVESRTKHIGSAHTIMEAGNQIAIRAAVMNPSSARREITALRAVCRHFLDQGYWPGGVDQIGLTENATHEDVETLLSAAMKTPGELIEAGKTMLPEYTGELMQRGFDGNGEEAEQVLTGFYPQRSKRPRQDRSEQQPITERDMTRLDLSLINHPPEDGIRSLVEKRADIKALLRIFTRVIWLTGMRPVEVFDCSLMCGNPDRSYTKAEIRHITQAPEEAVLSGVLIPQSRLDPIESLGFTRAVIESREATGVEPVLMIRNAKTVNANPGLVRAHRAQILKDVPEHDLHIICLAAMIRDAQIRGRRRTNMISGLTRTLMRISEEELPERKKPLNLYAFRHDFATRARRQLSIPRVASLMGHTSRTSTRGYGKTRTRKSGSGSGGWIPTCDENVAERLNQHLGTVDPAPGIEDPAPGI